jgi:replication factor C large subunit
MATILNLQPAHTEDVQKDLEKIALKEHLEISKEELLRIAERSNGDFRSAINDLQAIIQGIGLEHKENKPLDLEYLNRDRTKINCQDFVNNFFSTNSISDAKQVLTTIIQEEIDYNNIHKWINENLLSFMLEKKDIIASFENLTLADSFLGYIYQSQDWSLLSYFLDIIAGGIRFSKSDKQYRKSELKLPQISHLPINFQDDYNIKLQNLFRISLIDVSRELIPALTSFKKLSPELANFLNAQIINEK